MRAWFLNGGRRPMVVPKGGAEGFGYKSLVYDLLPAFDDGASGRIHIHGVPENCFAI